MDKEKSEYNKETDIINNILSLGSNYQFFLNTYNNH